MNIPQTTIEPFGYTGMPTVKLVGKDRWESLVKDLQTVGEDIDIMNVTIDEGVIKEWLESEAAKYDDIVLSCTVSASKNSANVYLITTLSQWINRIQVKYKNGYSN